MKVCSNCNSENLDHAKFCHNCGEAMADTLNCPSCKQKLEGDFTFCPHCGANLKSKENEGGIVKTERVKKEPLNKPKLYAIILNSVLILLSLVLCLSLLGSISKLPSYYETEFDDNVSNSVFDYFDSTFKIIDGFEKNQVKINDDFNYLNLFIANDKGTQIDFYKVVVILVLVVVLTMFILPVVLLGISINNLVKYNKSEGYKKYFTWFTFLPLLLVLIIRGFGFRVGSGVVLYIIFAALGIISLLVLHLIFERKQINVSSLILNTILVVSIFLFVLLVMTNFASYKFDTEKINVGFGDILSNFEMIFDKKDAVTPYSYYISQVLRDFETVSFYLQFLIPVLQILAIAFALSALISELKKDFLITKKTKSGLYLILSFVFYVLFIVSTIVFTVMANNDMKELGDNIKLSLKPGMFVVLVLLIGVLIYRYVMKKELEKVEY